MKQVKVNLMTLKLKPKLQVMKGQRWFSNRGKTSHKSKYGFQWAHKKEFYVHRKQKCIPVGCVPSNAVTVRGCLPGVVNPSMHWERGKCLPQCMLGYGGVYPSMHWARGVCPSAFWDSQPPVARILDTRLSAT